MSAIDCDNSKTNDIVFHLLDIQARDMRIESEQEDVREITYESNSESDDDEFKSKRKYKKNTNNFTQQKEFVIHLFGADETGKPIRCDVTGFRPTLYIRLPEDKTSQCAESIKQYINGQGIPMGQLNIKRITKKIFYGFTANTFYPFLQIDVPSLALFRNIRNLFLDENLNPSTKKQLDGPLRGKTIELFEANIDPMLRFIHTQNIQPCGWISIKDGVTSISEDGEDNSGIVIECDYEQVSPTKGPRVTAPFLTASWDIECFSMTGDFPLAKRTWKKTVKDVFSLAKNSSHVTQLIVDSLSTGQIPVSTLPIGMTPIYCQLKKPIEDIRKKLLEVTVQDMIEGTLKTSYGDIEYRIEALQKILDKVLKNLVCLVGDPVIQIGTTITRGTPETTERHLFVFPDCAPIPGISVHSYKTEKAMILAWFEWMIKINPDILIGYNVFGFDESYTWHRAEELGLIHANSPIHQFTRLFALSSEMKLEEKFLSSSAMGDNLMYIWTTHGRLQVDMFHYIKRNNVLPSYKLDEVTKHFMSGKLKTQKYEGGILTLEVAGAIKDVKPGRAITLLDDTGETVSPKMVVETVDGSKITFKCELDYDALNEMDDATKWVIVKDDVSPQDIFRLHRESAEGRAIVGKYCLQDCDLVIDLYKKLETFNNTMCMANVCSVPLSYIFTRGQGIKIESLIFKACKERDILIPVLTAPKHGVNAEDSYEGAIVLTPDPGFYSESPIGVCDFASLYPSSIVSENISHDSLLWIKDFNYDGTLISHNWGSEIYDECEGYAYTDIEFDIWRPDPKDTRKHPVKVRCGRRICRYAQPLNGTKSTLPQITTWLLNAREAKKKEMKSEKDPERYSLLDAEQLAYKLTGNSLYGQLGSGTFKVRLQALAASITSYGRKQLLFAKDAIELFYGPGANNPRYSATCMAKVVYGDSVTGDTPLILKNIKTNTIYIKRIDEIYSTDNWNNHHNTKECIDMSYNDIYVWTDKGFTKINKLIRHKLATNKKMFRINTDIGIVDVTEDHSLVLLDGKEAKPSDVVIGTELLHNDNVYNEFNNNTISTITENEAFAMGVFVADGSSDIFGLNSVENIPKYTQSYRELFYNDAHEKRIPDIILNAPLNIIQVFWDGFYSGDKDNNGYIRFDQKGKEIGAGLYIIARRLGYSVSISERVTKENTFRYTITTNTQCKSACAIKKFRELPHPGDIYVYDLETENHHFGVGPGALIVHNTDSLFVAFNPRNPETGLRLEGREARQATIDMTDEAGAFITKTLAAPHDFEFDKAFDPMLMFSKKRYAGNMYENNADDYVHKYMGIALKRRDNAPIVKTIFGGAMKMLLDRRDVIGAFKFIKDKCLELVDGKVSLGQLTVTKSLRADYANPLSIAHKVLADRITQRDPGNAPAAGDRIGYVYISPKAGQEACKLQGDRIETPLYVKENSLVPDYKHYIEHQLQNPISQAFGLLLERIPGFNSTMTLKCPPKPTIMDGSLEADKMLDAWLGFREAAAAQLLFSDCLKKFETSSRRSAIFNLFGGKAVLTTKPNLVAGNTKGIPEKGIPQKGIPQKVITQKVISSFLMDSYIVDSIRKKERATATAAKKKIKEQADAEEKEE